MKWEELTDAERAILFLHYARAWFDGAPHFYRASGDCVCRWCGKEYRKHPNSEHRAPESMGGYPFLRRLCNGDLVKL